MLRAILNKSWRQHPTRHQLYGQLPPTMKTIKVKRTWHAGHSWRSNDESISDILLWTLTYGQANTGRPAWTYIQQWCEDTGCSPADLPEAMNDREMRRMTVRDIRAKGTTWWWSWWWLKKHSLMIMLYFDLRPGPKCHSMWCTGRKWRIPMAVRIGNWLSKWDKQKNPMILS